MSFGDEFQQKSKYKREAMEGKHLDWDNRPETYKVYPPNFKRVSLSSPDRTGGQPLFPLFKNRRSIRNFTPEAISEKDLSQLLWACQGLTLEKKQHQFRTVPSAGALYPIETYVSIQRVEGVEPGIYHHEIPSHGLVLLKEGNFGPDLARAALGQKMLQKAAAVFVWSGVVERSKWKYDQRAYRYMYLDAGHIAQNLALTCVSCGLGSCQVAAFFDEEVNAVIGLDGQEETVLYMSALGNF